MVTERQGGSWTPSNPSPPALFQGAGALVWLLSPLTTGLGWIG